MQTHSKTRALPLALLSLSGCFSAGNIGSCDFGETVVDPLQDIVVTSARFDVADLESSAIVEGTVGGSGTVVVIDDRGDEHDFDAVIQGSIAGAGVEDSSIASATFPFTLPNSTTTVTTARDLFGEYTGAHLGVGVAFGGETADLANEAQVHLNITALSHGFGLDVGSWEDVTIALDNDPRRVEQCDFFGCPTDELGDGSTDASGAGEGEGESTWTGNQTCAHSDDAACSDDSDCCAGDICVGVCATQCGTFSVALDGTVTVTKFEPGALPLCPNGNTCQTVTSLPHASVVGVACMPRTLTRGAACFDILDDTLGDGACANTLDCRPTAVDAQGDYTAFTCEQPCTADADCAAGETCVTSSIAMPDGTALRSCVAR